MELKIGTIRIPDRSLGKYPVGTRHLQFRFHKRIISMDDILTPRSRRRFCPKCGNGKNCRDIGWGTLGYFTYRRVSVEGLKCMRCGLGLMVRIKEKN